ncbi:MAG TPA: toxic anion resistance protein [Candidatus Limnocylindrales bacterium]
MAATTQIAARFQDRPVRVLEEVLGERAPLTRHVRELEKMAAAMAERLAARGSPDGDADEPDDKDVQAAERVRELIPQLDADRALLETDNAALAQQEQALWREIETLRQYAALAARIDQLLADHVDGLQAADPTRAHALRVDVLFAVRRRRRDLLLQLAVATQGYSALRLIEQDNLEVIWALRSATTTTVSALRAASLASLATTNRAEVGRSASDGSTVGSLRQTLTDMVSALDAVEQRRRTTLEVVRRDGRG